MERAAEKECSALGGLFQLIINDLKMGSPAWEDFLGKATKLHSHLKTTLFALAAFLDAFQKIADLATGARGATKDIGTAMTRLCLRHRSIETKLKVFSSTIMDHLVIPLQERLEEWKKIAYQMDKDHAKEYKRVRQEIKKKSSDTLRLQKKVRKTGKGDTKKTLDTAIQDVNDKYHLLQETEKQAVRRALIEERGRYCLFVSCLRPVVESELATVHEVSHLQEVLDALAKLTEDPQALPSASEQVIADVKSTDSAWSFQTPPSSPTSLGSRKSSVCSISSLNSSSGDSSKSYSPSHHRSRSLSQQLPSGALRLLSVSSQDSGFTSQDTLFTRPPTPPPLEVTNQALEFSMGMHPSGEANACAGGTSPSFPPPPSVTATWPNLQDTEQFERAAASIVKSQRPHTISTVYERHQRPSLTTQTFQPRPADGQEREAISDSAGTLTSACSDETKTDFAEEQSDNEEYGDDVTPTHKPSTPPLPPRCSELNRVRPKIPQKPNILRQTVLSPRAGSLPTLDSGRYYSRPSDPVYVNSSDLGSDSSKAESVEVPECSQEKVSFHSDLAVSAAQKTLQQKQYRTLGHRSKVSALSQLVPQNTNDTEGHKLQPPVPPKTPPVHSDRRFSLPGPIPNLPPQKPDNFQKKLGPFAEKETSWNVFNDSNESTVAHSQLMQALNARLSLLQKQTTETAGNHRPPIAPDSRRFSVAVSSSQDREQTENTLQRRHLPAHPMRKPRAHSIGGTDREAFLNTLNSKFALMQEQSPSQTSPKKLNSSEATTPIASQMGLKDMFPIEDRAFSYQQSGTCQEIPCFDASRLKNNNPPTLFPTVNNVAIQQRLARQDRRHSVNIETDGSRMQTFFSPSANSKLMDESNQHQLQMDMDPSCGMMSDAAARVQTWLSGRGAVDLGQCRNSLLGQIRQGINLRKAPQINDRSAPFFHNF